MPTISIQLPAIEADQQVEVEVKLNGQKKKYHYRVEIFAWEQCTDPAEERAKCLQRMIKSYDEHWQLVQIGAPLDKSIPIMFKEKRRAEG